MKIYLILVGAQYEGYHIHGKAFTDEAKLLNAIKEVIKEEEKYSNGTYVYNKAEEEFDGTREWRDNSNGNYICIKEIELIQ